MRQIQSYVRIIELSASDRFETNFILRVPNDQSVDSSYVRTLGDCYSWMQDGSSPIPLPFPLEMECDRAVPFSRNCLKQSCCG